MRLLPFITQLKMPLVYPGLDLFSFCRPEMGKEHTDCVSFHLAPPRICPNVPLFIYSSSFSLPFFMPGTRKKTTGLGVS